MADYPDPRQDWVQRAEARRAVLEEDYRDDVPLPGFPAWVHQKPPRADTPLRLPQPAAPDPWAAKHMTAAGPDTPEYGSPEWSALDDNSPEKAAACVRAAQAWLEAKDPAVIAERVQAEVTAGRAEAERVQLVGVIETVQADANRMVQQVEPFSPAREVVQTPDWPAITPPGRPVESVPVPAAVEVSTVPVPVLPPVPAAYVTAETGPVRAASQAADPIRRAGQVAARGGFGAMDSENRARAYWEQRRAGVHASRGAGQGRG